MLLKMERCVKKMVRCVYKEEHEVAVHSGTSQ